MFIERDKKKDVWEEIIDNACEEGVPYKISDKEEYAVFDDECEWPASLDIMNRISEEGVEPTEYTILELHGKKQVRDEESEDPDAKKWTCDSATIWITTMEGLYNCKEYQELGNFPFDLQDLHLNFQLRSRNDIQEFDMLFHTVEFSKSCLELAEWVMYPPESDRKGTSKTSIRLQAARQPQFYLTNVVGMMFVVSLLCVASFGIDAEDIADRLSVTLTMMLTAVAFKFIVGDQLPKVPYSTYLDSYLQYTMGFMFSLSVYFCVAPHIFEDTLEDTDLIFLYVFSGIFVLYSGLWFFGAYLRTQAIYEEVTGDQI
eukprot:UN28780